MKTSTESDRTVNRLLVAALAVALFFLLASAAALAHPGHGDTAGGLISGFRHPITGLDHVVAMIAVGIWAAQRGGRAIWILPLTFPLVMAFGATLGALGVPIPWIEGGIALSAIALGSMIVSAARPPIGVAASMVALFAICHGYAHGVELPASADPATYAIGFVLATGSLHLTGIVLGVARRWTSGARLLRASGALIAGCGVWFLLPQLAGG